MRLKSHSRKLLVIVFAFMLAVAMTCVYLAVMPGEVYAATYTVTNTNDAGAGSLRQAILDANTNPDADLIDFNIGGGGPYTISITSSALPNITEEVTID